MEHIFTYQVPHGLAQRGGAVFQKALKGLPDEAVLPVMGEILECAYGGQALREFRRNGGEGAAIIEDSYCEWKPGLRWMHGRLDYTLTASAPAPRKTQIACVVSVKVFVSAQLPLTG